MLLAANAMWDELAIDAREASLLLNTLWLVAAVLLVALPLATLLAILLSRFQVPGRRIWETLLLLALFMPLYVQVAGWQAGFGRGGWYSSLVAGRLSDPPLTDFRGAVWVHTMAAVPWLFWLIRLGLASVPAELEQAARLDATIWRVLQRITLPLALPAIMAGALWVLVTVATEITVTDVYQVRTYAEELYSGFALGTELADLHWRVAPSVVLTTALMLSGLGACRLLWPTTRVAVDDTSATEPRSRSLGRAGCRFANCRPPFLRALGKFALSRWDRCAPCRNRPRAVFGRSARPAGS